MANCVCSAQYSFIKKHFQGGDTPKIFLDEEKITKLIKEVFEEEFKKQEVDITMIISSNFTLTMKEIKRLKQEVNDLTESKEFTQNDSKKKLLMCRKKISTFEIKMNEMHGYQIDLSYVNDNLSELEDKISEMEYRSRRNNIRVDGVTEEKGEMWEGVKRKS